MGQFGEGWAIKTNKEVDSGAFRLVNLTEWDNLSLNVNQGGTLSCAPMRTSGLLPVYQGDAPKTIRLMRGADVLLDTTVVAYPYMLTDIIVVPDGDGNASIRFVERLTTNVGRLIDQYWDKAAQVVVFPTGELVGGGIQLFDTAGRMQRSLRGLNEPGYVGVNLPRKQYGYDNVKITDASDKLIAMFDLRTNGRDSATYIMADLGSGVEIYSYDEFDESPQDLRSESIEKNPAGIPWKFSIASLVKGYDSLEVHLSTLSTPIGIASGWSDGVFGPVTGNNVPFEVHTAISPGGEVVGSGEIRGLSRFRLNSSP